MRLAPVDYDRAPLLVIWETTRSCALACRHCRASAELGRDPEELSLEEGCDLLDDVARMGTPLFVLSGGDPLNRPDLERLIAHGKRAGLRMATIPAATANLTPARLESLKRAGIDQLALSLDAPSADAHDSFRRSPGAFERTLAAAKAIRELGVPLQINTCFGAWNLRFLEEMIALVSRLGIAFWEVFFLVPVGRGREMDGLAPGEFERTFERLARLSTEVDWVVKLTEAPQFKRFAAFYRPPEGRGRPRMRPGPAVNAGKGFAFVDHRGTVYPSGFLGIAAGSVRSSPLSSIYRYAPIFQEMRSPERLRGKCAACEFRSVCGGSRARAWAMTGDPLAEDPACPYQPPAYRPA